MWVFRTGDGTRHRAKKGLVGKTIPLVAQIPTVDGPAKSDKPPKGWFETL